MPWVAADAYQPGPIVPGNSFCEALLCFVDPRSLCGAGEVWEVVLGAQQCSDRG